MQRSSTKTGTCAVGITGTSLKSQVTIVNLIDALAAEIDRVRADDDFRSRAKRLLERDKELLDRLAK